jgi:hypothetical protein
MEYIRRAFFEKGSIKSGKVTDRVCYSGHHTMVTLWSDDGKRIGNIIHHVCDTEHIYAHLDGPSWINTPKLLELHPRLPDISLSGRLHAAMNQVRGEMKRAYVCMICIGFFGHTSVATVSLGVVCNQCQRDITMGMLGGGQVLLLLRASDWLADIREIIIEFFTRL